MTAAGGGVWANVIVWVVFEGAHAVVWVAVEALLVFFDAGQYGCLDVWPFFWVVENVLNGRVDTPLVVVSAREG